MGGHYGRGANCGESACGILICCMCCGCILPWIFLSIGISKAAEHSSLTPETCEGIAAVLVPCTYQKCTTEYRDTYRNNRRESYQDCSSESGTQYKFSVTSTKCGTLTQTNTCSASPSRTGSNAFGKIGKFSCFIPDCSYGNAYLTKAEVSGASVTMFGLVGVFMAPWICIIAFICMAAAHPDRQSHSMQRCLWRFGCYRGYQKDHNKNKQKAHVVTAATPTIVIATTPMANPAVVYGQPVQAQPMMAQPMQPMMAQPMMAQPVQMGQMAPAPGQPMQYAPAPGQMAPAPGMNPGYAMGQMAPAPGGQGPPSYQPAHAPVYDHVAPSKYL